MVQLTESQSEAVRLLDRSNFALLTGGGGTGKTTLLAEWIKETPDMLTRCYAPTGKAAQRMGEAFAESGVDLSARTIHAGLIPTRTGYDGRGWAFEFNEDNTLPCDRVLIDECSMLGVNEMSWILKAIEPGTKVVLIGDPAQLPPVSKGCPFRDMIESKVFPNSHLTEVHRYAGRIAHVCKQIREGKTIKPSTKLDLDVDAGEFGPENYLHLERRTSYDVLHVMDVLCDRVKKYGIDPVKDMQVVVTRNESGGLSRKVVNPRLQELLNPDGGRYSKCEFRIGDKVICKKNNFRDEFYLGGPRPEKTGTVTYIANGEDGIVRFIEDKAIYVQHASGMVRYASGGWGREVVMGYALTTHACQGSGWPCVVYLVDDSILNDRNLVYTGLSRPKKMLFSVGRLSLLNQQVRKSQLDQRKTFLTEMLTEGSMA